MIYFFIKNIKFTMKKNFLKSTLILLIGSLITKILSLVIKINISRLIGTKGISMYMLILPTFMLFINLASFSTPLALSKLISEDKRNNKKLLFSITPILFIINILLIIIIILTSKYISTNLLRNKNLYLSILSMSLVIPFTTISSIIRSYFFGKEKMLPHVISNIIENITRLMLIIIGIPKIIKYGLKYTIAFIILSNIFSEIISTITLILFLPKKITIKKSDLKPNITYMKETLRICIPNTLSNLIGSIAYFLEPIIIIKFLTKNYSLNYITHEYGIISGYVIPLILLPSFFTLAISQALLPLISKEYVNGNIKYVKNKIKICLLLILLFSLFITIPLVLKGELFLKIIYNINEGSNYLKILSPIIILEYLQAPLSFCLEAIGKSKTNFISSLISISSRTISLIILSMFKIGIYSFIISISLNIILTTAYLYKKLKYYLNNTIYT